MCRDPNTSVYLLPLLLSATIVGIVGRQNGIKKSTLALRARQTQFQKPWHVFL